MATKREVNAVAGMAKRAEWPRGYVECKRGADETHKLKLRALICGLGTEGAQQLADEACEIMRPILDRLRAEARKSGGVDTPETDRYAWIIYRAWGEWQAAHAIAELGEEFRAAPAHWSLSRWVGRAA